LIGRLSVVAIVVALLLAGYVYAASERVLHRTYDIPLPELSIPTDSASIVEGARLVAIRGCKGCHGDQLQGALLQDDFEARVVAPNLTHVAAKYSPGELARAIRLGVRANGEGLWVMPSGMFYHLSDRDLARIIAFLRAAPRVESGFRYQFRPGPLVRWEMMTGSWWDIPEDVRRLGPRMRLPQAADATAVGEYLAQTSCTECHGVEFRGDGAAPDLAIAAIYSLDDFARLMRTGTALGERELPLMSSVARGRFSQLTEAEVEALYTFLQDRARRLADDGAV
jgi:mono/diheme cytochrome c family protein